jgi:hypothetical protein
VRSVSLPSFAGSLASWVAASLVVGAVSGCGGTPAVTSTPATVASAPAPRALADPAVPGARPPGRPRKTPPYVIPRMGPVPRLGVPAGDPLAREVWNGIDPQAQGDLGAVDRWLRLYTLADISNKKSDFWSPCVRDFVALQPEAARDALGEALSQYGTACTGGPSRRIEFQTPRADRAAPAQSYVGLVGALERTSCELALRAAYHGPPVRAERITLIADGVRWSSPRIDFDDNGGWEIATLPLSRELARVVKRAAEARDALLRFESERAYEDVVLTDDMKQDLRVLLDALDAINRP